MSAARPPALPHLVEIHVGPGALREHLVHRRLHGAAALPRRARFRFRRRRSARPLYGRSAGGARPAPRLPWRRGLGPGPGLGPPEPALRRGERLRAGPGEPRCPAAPRLRAGPGLVFGPPSVCQSLLS